MKTLRSNGLAAGAAALVFAAGANFPARAQSGDAMRGATLAQSWCASCHVVDRQGSGRTADTAPPFPVVAVDPARTPDSWRAAMTGQHTRMPNFNLSRREIDDLVAHIRSLAATP